MGRGKNKKLKKVRAKSRSNKSYKSLREAFADPNKLSFEEARAARLAEEQAIYKQCEINAQNEQQRAQLTHQRRSQAYNTVYDRGECDHLNGIDSQAREITGQSKRKLDL